MSSLEKAIHQKVFLDPYIKADINIMYTASWLATRKARALRHHGLTWQQFNVLRILRGSRPTPVTLSYVAERMIDQTSNASRLVDKLVSKELVERTQCPADRRQVNLLITEQGMVLVEQASHDLESSLHETLRHLTSEEASTLNRLLDTIRQSTTN